MEKAKPFSRYQIFGIVGKELRDTVTRCLQASQSQTCLVANLPFYSLHEISQKPIRLLTGVTAACLHFLWNSFYLDKHHLLLD